MIWSLRYRAQGREAILSGETENKDEKLKWYANTTNPSLTSSGCKTHTDDDQPTCSWRMLLSAVSSRSDRSTVSIWLANSWRLWINKLRDIWSCQHELERNRKLGLTLCCSRTARSPLRCCWGCWWQCRRSLRRWESRWPKCCKPSPCGVELSQRGF